MAKKDVGATFAYTDDNEVTYLATVMSTWTDEDTNKEMCTLSLAGKGSTITIENK